MWNCIKGLQALALGKHILCVSLSLAFILPCQLLFWNSVLLVKCTQKAKDMVAVLRQLVHVAWMLPGHHARLCSKAGWDPGKSMGNVTYSGVSYLGREKHTHKPQRNV